MISLFSSAPSTFVSDVIPNLHITFIYLGAFVSKDMRAQKLSKIYLKLHYGVNTNSKGKTSKGRKLLKEETSVYITAQNSNVRRFRPGQSVYRRSRISFNVWF